jgi:sulfate permease, SulP family
VSAAAVTFLAIPQGVAYALIAGIPPVMGLYAATIPTFIGSLFRSSRHVVTGPTNAVSLLVGTAVAAGMEGTPTQIAITLAFMVAAFQIAAGALRLGPLVYFISVPVVLGYITGAGVLIGVGQLKNVTGTEADRGHVVHQLLSWWSGLGATDTMAVSMAVGTVALILLIRKVNSHLPSVTITIAIAIAVTWFLGLDAQGLEVIRDKSPIEARLPGLHAPTWGLVHQLMPVAVAVTLLSLVESTSVARSIAGRTGQRLDLSAEFTGEGLANLASSLFGGYPTTGSLSRSAINEREGAVSRLSGALSGVFVLLSILAFGPVLNYIPIAALAGLLLVVAAGLIDHQHVVRVLRSDWADRLAFLGTLAGTFFLHLDQAIYVGVGISLMSYLQNARLLSVRDLVIDKSGRLREASARTRHMGPRGFTQADMAYCRNVLVLNVEGSLFFGAAGELQTALDDVSANTEIRVLVIRLKRARNLDITTVDVLVNFARQWRREGREVLLVGMLPGLWRYLERSGAVEDLGQDSLFPQRPDHWFVALEDALTHAFELVGEGHDCDACALETWMRDRGVT